MHVEKRVPARIWPVLKAYAAAARKYPAPIIWATLAAIGIEVAGVAAPLYLKEFVNALVEGATTPGIFGTLFVILGMYALINFGNWVCQRVRMLTLGRVETRIMADLFQNAFDYLLRHSHEFFISNFTGSLTRRVARYARAFEPVLDNVLLNLLPTVVFILGVVWVLSLRYIWLGVGLLIWTAIFIYVQYRLVRWLQPLRTKRIEEDSRVTGALSDSVMNHSAVTAFAALPHELSIFGKVTEGWRDATQKAMDGYTFIYGIQGFLAFFIEIALLAAAAVLWQKGFLTVGDFVLIQVYIIGLLNRVWGIGRNMRHLYDSFSEATEMIEIFEQPHAIQDIPGAKSLVIKEGAIEFRNVAFNYGDGEPLLKGFSLAIAPSEKVALVGASGAGKTTVTKLLLRLYDIQGGEIAIDGQNIAEVTQDSLRSACSLVPQEPILFHRSLMENIRYGKEKASDAEVIEAAKQAHCYEFISKYPHGFETLVGERGVKLSGGERQRIAIARAILKDAPILILDEATSSLDSESEMYIQDALARLMEGKTVIAIAHRLSTVMKMNRIVVIEDGRVVLAGSHSALLKQKSNLYKKLWQIQAGGFLPDGVPS